MPASNSYHRRTMPQTQTRRYPGLEWLRAGATIGVVLLHAAIPYATHPLPGLVWTTFDRQPSPWVDAVVWNINCWVMPLFFLMSGFLAAGLLRNLGPRKFFQHRLTRIGGPLLFGLVFILPLDLYAFLISWVNQGWLEPVKLRSLKVDGPLASGLWGLSHLWYLEYLLLYCTVMAAMTWFQNLFAQTQLKMQWRPGRNALPAILRNPPRMPAWRLPLPTVQFDLSPFAFTAGRRLAVASILLMSTASLTLWWQPRVLIGFRHSFFPLPENFLFFGTWFLLGWVWEGTTTSTWDRSKPQSETKGDSTSPGQLSANTGLHVALGLIGFHILRPLLLRHLEHGTPFWETGLLAAGYAAVGWCIAAGLFQWGLSWRLVPPRPVTYVAEASFWIYLVHHPVIALVQGNMAVWSCPAWGKFAIAAGTGLGFALLSYEAGVRRTWLGALLNGRRPQAVGLNHVPRQDVDHTSRAA